MNLPTAEFDPRQLMDEYFLRDFSREEAAALSAALSRDAALRADFIQNLNGDLDLYAACQHAWEEPGLRDQPIVVFPPRKRSKQHHFHRVSRLAASIMVVLGLGLAYLVTRYAPPSAPASGARVADVAIVTDVFAVRGEQVIAEHGGEGRPLGLGDSVRVGERVAVPAGGRVALAYTSDGTTVVFEENSDFRVGNDDGAKRIELDAGRLFADVAKQPQGKPFRVITDDAEVVVLGTRFELLNHKETRLSVLSGQVQMNDLFDDDSVSVSAGQCAESDQGAFSEVMSFHRSYLKPISSGTLPKVPYRDAKNRYIIVDSKRVLKGRIAFRIPPFTGRIREASLRLRVVSYKNDRGGEGTVRVNRVGRKGSNEIGRHSGRVSSGMDLIFQLDPDQLTDGVNHFLLTMDHGGNDFWFSAQDSQFPPELRLTFLDEAE